MKLSILFLASLMLFSTIIFSREYSTRFKSSINPISSEIKAQMLKYTWHPTCPVTLNDLSEVKLIYWGFDHKPHQGELIVNKALAKEIVAIFKELYHHRFPIQRMELMDAFKGDDMQAMNANNTSAFNCREVTGQPGVFSQHSYGRAIDINTLINPYVKGNQVLPEAGKVYANRSTNYPGKITKNSFIYNTFQKYNWNWGGDWDDLKDYQHFEKRANDEKRDSKGY